MEIKTYTIIVTISTITRNIDINIKKKTIQR